MTNTRRHRYLLKIRQPRRKVNKIINTHVTEVVQCKFMDNRTILNLSNNDYFDPVIRAIVTVHKQNFHLRPTYNLEFF